MRDVNGSSFSLLAESFDWTVLDKFAPDGAAFSLASKQPWNFAKSLDPATAIARLAASQPFVRDEYGVIARINADGSKIESQDGGAWVPLTASDGKALAPHVGRFAAMALGDARLALLSTDSAAIYLQLFDLRERWPLDAPNNPALPIAPDASGGTLVVASTADGAIFLVEQGGLGLYEGGPKLEFFRAAGAAFAPLAPNSDPLRRTKLIARPAGKPIAISANKRSVVLLIDDGTGAQQLHILDRASGQWTQAPVKAQDSTSLPYATDVALFADGKIALVAPSDAALAVRDCIVATAATQSGLQLANYRYPMLSQGAPRFASGPARDPFYVADGPQLRALAPLPHPAYQRIGAMLSRTIKRGDPDQVWHRLIVEAHTPGGASLIFWARAAETGLQDLLQRPDLPANQTLTSDDLAALVKLAQTASTAPRRLDATAARQISDATSNALAFDARQSGALLNFLESGAVSLLGAGAPASLAKAAATLLTLDQTRTAALAAELQNAATAANRLDALAPNKAAQWSLTALGLSPTDAERLLALLAAPALLDESTTAALAQAITTTFALDAQQAASLLQLLKKLSIGVVRLDDLAAIDLATTAGLAAPSSGLQSALRNAPFHRQPDLALLPSASELPFHPGLAALAKQPGELYELLLQRSCGANRRLVGGALELIAIGESDGRNSPCLRAARVYASRFCYQDQYLPEHFHQTVIADESDAAALASPPDFRERFLAICEGMLTPIEGRAAVAEYLLDPQAAPADQLPWLASYLGLAVDPSWPETRQRRYLAQAGRLLRERGTYRGVCLAVDIATDGAVARGEVVLFETFRLRRANATILGVTLSDRNILTQYGVASGNSIVGETLILSPKRALDMLTLLSPDASRSSDLTTAGEYLDQYADRIQIAALIAGPQSAALRDAVTTTLTRELPAHLAFDVISADHRFVLGLAPLLGVDTFLDPPDAPASAQLDASAIGRDAVIRNPAALRQ